MSEDIWAILAILGALSGLWLGLEWMGSRFPPDQKPDQNPDDEPRD